jgi:peroxiredoxin
LFKPDLVGPPPFHNNEPSMNLRQPFRTALLCTLLALSSVAAADDAVVKLNTGDMAPDIVGKTADNEPFKLSDHRGKVIVLSYWATWCGYCLKELPVLEALQNSAAAPHLRVIAVNTEAPHVFREARREMRKAKMSLIYDPGEVGQKAYGVKGLPHMVIIGRDGRVIRVYRGYAESMLETIVGDINTAVQMPAEPTAGAQPAA